jgi:geranyl diphosphate synthase
MLAARGACRRASSRWIAAFGGRPDVVVDAAGAPAPRFGAPEPGPSRRDRSRAGPRRAFAAHSAALGEDLAEDDEAFARVDPFSLVKDELGAISERMRRAVTSEVPALKTAAEYFFRTGSEGKRVRPTVLLLMASALGEAPIPGGASNAAGTLFDANAEADDDARVPDHAPAHVVPTATRRRQQRLAEITELIHVASLLHDDVIDGSATRRGLKALNLEVGNKLAILAGDFLLARASVTLASLRDVEVIELLSRVLEHLVTGEVMQMTALPEDLVSFEHYTRKTYLKTASLIANSSKAVAILGGHESDGASATAAYAYGKHLGLAFQFQDDVLDFVGSGSILGKPTLGDLREGIATAPVLFAAEEFPDLRNLIGRRFKSEGDVERAAAWVKQSRGIEETKRLARAHAAEAVAAIDALPPADKAVTAKQRETQLKCRRALKELARVAVERIK